MRNIILALCVLALIAGGGYYFTKSNDNKSTANSSSQSVSKSNPIDEKPMVTLNKQEPVQPSAPVEQKPEPTQESAPATQNQAPENQADKPVQNQNEQPTQNAESQAAPANAEQANAQNQANQNANVAAEQPATQTDEAAKEEPKADVKGIEIDPSGARINFLSYKMPNKMKVPETGTPATFKTVEFNFANQSGSVAEILTNSTAKIDLSSIDTNKNAIRDNNVKNKFFAHLASQEVSGKITGVKGDDTSGDLTLSLNFNGIEKEVPLKYEVKDGKLTATGEIDLVEGNLFNTAEAFEKFASEPVIQGLHGKKSWSDIQIGFEVPVK